jgi:Rad3-related DNA helicase
MFRSVEQSNFSARIAAHIQQADAPLLLEGTTGLGKTRAYLAALNTAIQQGKRVAIVVPTHALIEQILASSDLALIVPPTVTRAAFKPKSFYSSAQEFKDAKALSLESSLMICTSSSVIVDQRAKGNYNGVTTRDYILFDEADQLPQYAALSRDREIRGAELRELGVRGSTTKEIAEQVIAHKGAETETRAAAVMILEALDEPAWYHNAGKTDDGGIALFHKMPGRLLKKIANRSNVAFISATLSIGGKFDDFKRAMGIGEQSALSAIIEPAHHGTLKFFHEPHPVLSQEWLTATTEAITKAKKPTLVVTPSNELSQTLGALFPDAIIRAAEEKTSDAILRLTDDQNILIASAAWAGLDTPIEWKSIVIPRIPFLRPQVIDGNIESSFFDSRNSAIRRMRQVIGRGLRKPEAECEVYILDDRLAMIESFIPTRFKDAWHSRGRVEGARVEHTLSKAERDPLVRKNALKHHGKRCMSCDFVPKVDSQLEVHHLFPLADGGERVTKIQTDVAVLCANCHRLAHSASPPLPLGVLRGLHQDGGSSG